MLITSGGLIFLVGCAVFFFAVVKDKWWGVSVGVPLILGTMLLLAALALGEKEIKFREIVKEVNLREVAVVGKDQFNAQIEIIYQNGQLLRVTLVPKTTTKVAIKEETENK